MGMSRTAIEALRAAEGHFNEDWGMDFAGWDEALEAFLSDHEHDARDISQGLVELLALDDESLERAFRSTGIPSDQRLGPSRRDFLGRLLDALKRIM